jgi:mRNA-degrading endonuclease toxin of MazEF toxin-antitoxin module
LEWIKLKEDLHNKKRIIPPILERDIWWVSFGENIGSEINGKSKWFSRPGLVLKKLSRGSYLVAPTTSKKREGTWYVEITLDGKKTYVCLHQIRIIDYRRLSSQLGHLEGRDFRKVKEALARLYK